MKVSLNWLKDFVAIKGSYQTLAHDLTMAGLEVRKVESTKDDTIFETDVTTNRPDWLSHLGVAREIHAVRGSHFALPPHEICSRSRTTRSFKISILDPELCPYYSAVLIEGVVWNETPELMRRRLEACGTRSVNLIVDITNYVLLELGQPLHAFDADRLNGEVICARRARKGEKMVAIDGVTYELEQDDLVIADSKGAVAIGGVMGGKDSEVSQKTTNILLESAFFAPSAIRKTSRRLGLASESSYRFERRVDPLAVSRGRERAVCFIQKYCCPRRISRVFQSGDLPVKEPVIPLALSQVERVLGIRLPSRKVQSLLKRLGLQISGTAKKLTVRVPSFRSDLTRPIDLIEEVARLHGYEKIPETLPSMVPQEPDVEPVLELEDRVRTLCVSLGLQEAITFGIVESAPLEKLGLYRPHWIRLVNPQNKELDLMRPTLLPGLLAAIRCNVHVGETDVRLFELGNRYLDGGQRRFPSEERTLALAISGEGKTNWMERPRAAGFYDLKGIIHELILRLGIGAIQTQAAVGAFYESGKGVCVRIQGEEVGHYGTLSRLVRDAYDVKRPVFFAELNLEKIASFTVTQKSVEDISKFPSSPRDLTVILPEAVRAQEVIDEIEARGGDWVQRVEVFDYFKGERLPPGKKSLSFRIHYQAKDRTLQNEEVNRLHFSMMDSMSRKFDAQLPEG